MRRKFDGKILGSKKRIPEKFGDFSGIHQNCRHKGRKTPKTNFEKFGGEFWET